jgi:site-specific recombinase XerD
MVSSVVRSGRGHRLTGDDTTVVAANRFLGHLETRCYSPATVRAYAFDLSNFALFLTDRSLTLDEVRPTDLFDYLDWQQKQRPQTAAKVVPIRGVGAAPATMNRRIASVRGLFEHMVIEGTRQDNPVPAARRSSGLRSTRRGLLGHVPAARQKRGGRLVRQPQRLPESLDPDDVALFLNDLETHRDRAIVLAMVFGGLRAAEVRGLRLANIDMGLKRVRVVGKGGRERIVPVDPAFFSECAAYVRTERPPGCKTPECFVVLRGPTTGDPLTEDGLRKIFRTHRDRSGAMRVRPHRLRHTYGTELATAGVDLLVLRELMGHASPETTAAYVHLSPDTLAAEFAAARKALGR